MELSNLRNRMSPAAPVDLAKQSANAIGNKLSSIPQFQLPASPPEEAKAGLTSDAKPESDDLRKAFQDFVGQTLFSQMIGSMRETTKGSAYFNGGQAEKIFQGQLDQLLSEKLSESSAAQISDPMFKLFQLRRNQ